ncbi:MAG: FHA domain-containing protein [Planctomycetota bacterium]|nr:FHA domain-containing protein [Planctomycetota bacterium]
MVQPKQLVLRVDDFIAQYVHCNQTEFTDAVQGPLLVFNVKRELFLLDLGLAIGARINKITLGRSQSADLRFEHDGVSRIHAELYSKESEWFLRDCGSRNGVSKYFAQKKSVLKKGESISLDQVTRFGLGNGPRLQIYSPLALFRKIRQRREEEWVKRSTDNIPAVAPSDTDTITDDFLVVDGSPKNVFVWAKEMKGETLQDFFDRTHCYFLRLLSRNDSMVNASHLDETVVTESLAEYEGAQSPEFWPLVSRNKEDSVYLGRSPGNDVHVSDATVSRKHLVFRFNNEKSEWTIEDLGSKNGVFLDGNPVVTPTKIDDEACIRVGREVLIQFHNPRAFYSLLKVYSKL